MARPKRPVSLGDDQRAELIRRTEASSAPVHVVLRARIVLRAAEGIDNAAIAEELQTSKVTVGLWRTRFLELGLEGLDTLDRPGRPRSLPEEKVRKVIAEGLIPPPGRMRWSRRTMAKAAGISVGSVHKLWKENNLQPEVPITFRLTNPLNPERHYWDVVGLYLDSPTQAMVLCCDERRLREDLARSHNLMTSAAAAPTVIDTPDKIRASTVALFAALNYIGGKILQLQKAGVHHGEWLEYLGKIEGDFPAEISMHLIIESPPLKKHTKVKKWMKTHLRFRHHFAPEKMSWMEMVEKAFRELGDACVLPGSLGQVPVLTQAIFDHMGQWNMSPPRFEWRASGPQVLQSFGLSPPPDLPAS